jgi:alpha-D-ribose 1-methylphosphonate 5-triphosphate diphosphatase
MAADSGHMAGFEIASTRILIDGALHDTALRIEDGRIAALDRGAPNRLPGRLPGRSFDASRLMVLPGIVDLHGDGFERQRAPRPGLTMPAALALIDTDRQLIANGITTAFLAVRHSWDADGAPAGRTPTEQTIHALERQRPVLACDIKLHLRHEAFHLDGMPALERWLAAGVVDLLGFHDRTLAMVERADRDETLAPFAAGMQMSVTDMRALLMSVAARGPEVPAAVERIAARARGAGVAMASHDDASPDMRRWFHALGCTLSEFPTSRATARTARELGNHVILRAAGVIAERARGGDADGENAAGAATMDLIEQDLCTVLASDCAAAAPLQAAWALARTGVLPFAASWRLVSANPAMAAGLDDRGAVRVGARADLICVDDSDPALPRVAAVFVAGRLVHLADAGRSWH